MVYATWIAGVRGSGRVRSVLMCGFCRREAEALCGFQGLGGINKQGMNDDHRHSASTAFWRIQTMCRRLFMCSEVHRRKMAVAVAVAVYTLSNIRKTFLLQYFIPSVFISPVDS